MYQPHVDTRPFKERISKCIRQGFVCGQIGFHSFSWIWNKNCRLLFWHSQTLHWWCGWQVRTGFSYVTVIRYFNELRHTLQFCFPAIVKGLWGIWVRITEYILWDTSNINSCNSVLLYPATQYLSNTKILYPKLTTEWSTVLDFGLVLK